MADYQLKSGETARIVTTIVWLDELERLYPANPYGRLLEYLEGLHIEAACSPVHDKDTYTKSDVRAWMRRKMDKEGRKGALGEWMLTHTNEQGVIVADDGSVCPSVGDPKKAHVHVYLQVKGARNRVWWARLLCDLIEGFGEYRFEKVPHPDSLLRYFAHLDDPEKHLYSSTDIHGFGGLSLACLLREDQYVKVRTLHYVMEHIEDHKIRHYHKLVRWAFSLGDYEIISCVTGRASYFAAFFKSISDEKREKDERDRKLKEQAAQ